jgi:hypothetical protein
MLRWGQNQELNFFPGEDIMTADKEGHFSKKHGDAKETDPLIADALKKAAEDGHIPCAVAFKIAAATGKDASEIGVAADLLELRLCKCQLGLFGYTPQKCIVKAADEVSENLRERIQASLSNNRIPCSVAWDIAKAFALRKMEVSSACEKLGIKISHCQLGAF